MGTILDLLNGGLGQQIISGVSQKTGIDQKSTANVLAAALPALLGGMQKNAANPQGAASLLSALQGGQHNGNVLDNISGFLGGSDFSDGTKILGHVLGNNQNALQSALSQKTGVSAGQVGSILQMAAPLVMAYLGKQTQQNNISNNNGLAGLLGGLIGGQSSNNPLSALLGQSGGGIAASLLGNLFKKR